MTGEAAGFWRRFAGAFIDGLVVGIPETILRVFLGAVGELVGIVLSFAYYTYFHGATGQTPGNAALGIRVVDIETGQVIGYQRAFVRALVSVASYVIVLLGFLWMLWDREKQTWHDKAARSIPIHPA